LCWLLLKTLSGLPRPIGPPHALLGWKATVIGNQGKACGVMTADDNTLKTLIGLID